MGSTGVPLLLSLTALGGVRWLVPHPGRFTRQNETPYPFYRRLGVPWGRNRPTGVEKVIPNRGSNFEQSSPPVIQYIDWRYFCTISLEDGGTVVKVLCCYKSEGRWFDLRLCHWIFPLTYFFRSRYGPGVDSASNKNEYREYFLGVNAAGA
jgi:hypothetical protein